MFMTAIEAALTKWQFRGDDFQFDLEIEFRLREPVYEDLLARRTRTKYEIVEHEDTRILSRILIEADKFGPNLTSRGA
jgi:hypothetical protein